MDAKNASEWPGARGGEESAASMPGDAYFASKQRSLTTPPGVEPRTHSDAFFASKGRHSLATPGVGPLVLSTFKLSKVLDLPPSDPQSIYPWIRLQNEGREIVHFASPPFTY